MITQGTVVQIARVNPGFHYYDKTMLFQLKNRVDLIKNCPNSTLTIFIKFRHNFKGRGANSPGSPGLHYYDETLLFQLKNRVDRIKNFHKRTLNIFVNFRQLLS